MKHLFDRILAAYQWAVSPLLRALGCSCRFHPTCSCYARDAIKVFPWWRACGLIARRLVRCGPWHPGGIDIVPNS